MKIMRECFNPAVGSDSLIGEYLTEGFREGRDQGINGYLVHNVPEYADQYNYIVARYIPDKDEFWFWGAWKDEKPALEAARDIDGQVIYRNGYNNDHNIANDYPSEETDESLKEDKLRESKVIVYSTYTYNKDDDFYLSENGFKNAENLDANDLFTKKIRDAHKFKNKKEATDFCKENGVDLKSVSFISVEDNFSIDESLTEDTVKQGKKWVNKGEDGTHGKFNTKKEADAQRKAMFANGYKEGLEEAKTEDKEEFDETAEAQTVKDFIDTFKDYDKDLALEFKPIIIDDKEYAITGIITDDSEEGKITVEIQYVAPETEEEPTDEAEDFEAEENDEWEDEVEESLTEDKDNSKIYYLILAKGNKNPKIIIRNIETDKETAERKLKYYEHRNDDFKNPKLIEVPKTTLKSFGYNIDSLKALVKRSKGGAADDKELDKLSNMINKLLKESLTEDKTVDYVDYKHSYCHELEPKMKQLNYMCNVLKVPTGDVIKKILGILKSAKNINKTEKEQWFYDTIKNKKWNNSKEIYQFIKNSINKAKEVEATVDDKGELKKESLKEDANLINAKVADVEYNDDDGYDRHVLLYLGNEDKTEEEIENDLTEQGMIYVFVNDIFEKEIPAKNYSLYDVIESYDVPEGEGVSATIGGEYDDEDDDEWEDEDELTEYLVKGLQEHINDRPDPIEDKSEFKGQDNAVVDCPVSKLIAHSEDEKPLDCEMKKEPLPKNLTTK